ncbi:MAG: DUF1207 domain-containing protein [Promethearchaeota archaeon]|jgi:hypothetical protein
MKLLLSSILSLLICSSALAKDTVKFSSFNLRPLYREPFAGLRSPDTGFTINTSKYQKQRVKYFEASLGKNVPIVTMHINPDSFENELTFQLGLAAGFWGTLGYDDGAFPLLTEDFLISIPLEFRWGNWSGAVKFNHISAHLGDGFEGLLEEELSPKDQEELDTAEDILEDLSGNEDVGITLKEPFAYSRDFMSFHVAYNHKIGILNGRTYAHVGYAHKMIPDDLKRWFVGSGFEAIYPSDTLAPYYAQDVTWNEDTDSVDVSVELGVVVLSSETKYCTLRVALTGYIGTDRRGQLMDNRLKQFGFGFFIY